MILEIPSQTELATLKKKENLINASHVSIKKVHVELEFRNEVKLNPITVVGQRKKFQKSCRGRKKGYVCLFTSMKFILLPEYPRPIAKRI